MSNPTEINPDPDGDRCAMYAQDPFTTRRPRVDGYRCGHTTDRRHNHELFTADGEGILYAGSWADKPRVDQ